MLTSPSPRPELTALMRTRLQALLASALLVSPGVAAQDCPQPPPPLTHGPIAGIDVNTLALGSFDGTLQMVTPSGGNLLKGSHQVVAGGGIFGTDAVRLSNNSVGMWRLQNLNKNLGTIEFWVRPGPNTTEPQWLFSLRGTRSLNGDGFTDLVVGEPTSSTAPAQSVIYYGTPTGLNLTTTTTVTTRVPRGMGMADVNADGFLDLLIANNQGAGFSTPGSVDVHLGPISPGSNRPVADVAVEVPFVQGLTAADFDQDGDVDFVGASYLSDSLAVGGWINSGGSFSPAFGPAGLEFVTSGEGTAAGDVNGDGVLDLLYGSFSSIPSYMLLGALNGGSYDFDIAVGVSTPRSEQTLGVSLGDLNGDGHLDAALAQPLFDNGAGLTPGRVALHFNDGSGGFQPTPEHAITTTRPFTVQAGKDVNNDGHIDVAVANWRDGLTTTPESRVILGPFPPAGGGPSPELRFLVNDAVSMAFGDLDNDGFDDLFLRSSSGTSSPVFLLTANGTSKAGVDGQGRQLPSYSIPTQPTSGNPGGEGAGILAAQVGGTTPYGSHHDNANSFEVFVQNGQLIFRVTDRRGVAHQVAAPVPDGNTHPDAVDGFVHVQCGWWGPAGLVEMRIGHPDDPSELYRTLEPAAWFVSSVSPVFRLGTDFDNRRSAGGWLLDDLRISNIRRTTQDLDSDGFQDEWDNCPATSNPTQADGDDDGLGDACMTCQSNLGQGGPGTLVISICGAPLCTGSLSAFEAGGGPPGALTYLVVGDLQGPVPFKGGSLVPWPVILSIPLHLDPAGRLTFPVPGGSGFGPLSLTVQLVAVDPGQTLGYALSNGLLAVYPE